MYILFHALLSASILIPIYVHHEQRFIENYRNSRILSFANSIITSIIGLYSYVQYINIGVSEYSCDDTLINQFVSVFLMVYLLLDLSIGYMRYRPAMGLLSGYIHHTVFIFVMAYIINTGRTSCSSLLMILEVPTIFLCLKQYIPQQKLLWELLFGLLFFIFRLVFNFRLIVDIVIDSMYYHHTDKALFVPLLLGMLSLHVYWFNLYILRFS